jgi:acetoin utilization protein AcuB
MSKLTKIIGDFGANISNVAVYRGTGGKSNVVIGVNSHNTTEMEQKMEEEGFKVLYKLQIE